MSLKEKEIVDKLLKNLNVNKLMSVLRDLNSNGRYIVLKGLSEQLDNNKKMLLVSQLKTLTTNADKEIKEWLITAMSKSYTSGMNLGVAIMAKKGIKIAGVGKISVDLLLNSAEFSPHLASVNALLNDTYLDFGSAMTNFARSGERILSDALKQQIRSTLISGRLEGDSINTIKKGVKEALADKGFIALTDKGGKTWSLDTYGEMLARTHIMKANTEGAINRAKDFDVDIVEISTHNANCSICSPYEGKLFSISGQSKNYPPLTGNEPPYHPNCAHTIEYRPDLE